MKLGELMLTSMINDETVIIANKPFVAGVPELTRKGHWYVDCMLDLTEEEITKLTYIQKENKVYVELAAQERMEG